MKIENPYLSIFSDFSFENLHRAGAAKKFKSFMVDSDNLDSCESYPSIFVFEFDN